MHGASDTRRALATAGACDPASFGCCSATGGGGAAFGFGAAGVRPPQADSAPATKRARCRTTLGCYIELRLRDTGRGGRRVHDAAMLSRMVEELEPCPNCKRHVRMSERACPFCREKVSLVNGPVVDLPNARLSRGQIMAFRTLVGAGLVGASAAGLASGCAVYGAPCDPPNCDGSPAQTAGSGGAGGGGRSATGGAATGGVSGSGGSSGTGGVAGQGGESGGAGLGGEGGG